MLAKEKRPKYDRQFKLEAVRLSYERGRSVSGLARNLGFSANVLHRWRKQLANGGETAFPGKGHMTPEQEELRRLRRELADVTEERNILKKALAVFSRRRD